MLFDFVSLHQDAFGLVNTCARHHRGAQVSEIHRACGPQVDRQARWLPEWQTITVGDRMWPRSGPSPTTWFDILAAGVLPDDARHDARHQTPRGDELRELGSLS